MNTIRNINEEKINKSNEFQEDSSNDLLFSKKSVAGILQKLRGKKNREPIDRNLLLDLIRYYNPITIYELAKRTGLSYNSIKDIVRDFEHAGLVYFRFEIGSNNRTHKLILIPKEVKNENN